jgi:hypothetical protein
MQTPENIIILGLPALVQLPIVVKYAGRTIFEGCPPVQVVAEPPTHPVGEGIQFVHGNEYQRNAVKALIVKFKDNIFEWSGKFGLFRDYVEDVPVTTTDPVQVKPYRVPAGLHPAFEGILEEYLRRKIIEAANSPYSSPAFLVPKGGAKPTDIPSKRYRMCCDYREINKITEDAMFPVFDVQQLLDALGSKNEFFATIDLRMGYHHIPLSAEGKRKTAFSTPQGQFQFRVLSFGMKRSPRIFQRALHLILGDLVWKACLVYLDDIIIFGPDFETFLANLTKVFERLAQAGASISLDKSRFLAKEVKFLGFIVDKDTCRPAPETVETIKAYPLPRTPKELQRFLGLASYVRQYIQHFATMERCLRSTIQVANKPLVWSPAAEHAFQQLKDAIAADTRLRRFDPNLYTEIQCDASQETIGAVLLQGQTPDQLYVLEFASKVLQPHQQRYSNTERELYAIKWAITEKFRPYVEGRHVVVATDHQALVHECRLKEPSRQIVQFKLKLESYDYTLKYIKGKVNVAADALSRIPIQPASTDTVALCATDNVNQGSPPCLAQTGGSPRLVGFQGENQVDTITDPPLAQLQELPGEPRADAQASQGAPSCLAPKDGNATYVGFPVQFSDEHSHQPTNCQLQAQCSIRDPKEQRSLVDRCHEQMGHAGWLTVFKALRTRFYWPRMRQIVFQQLKGCVPCILHGTPTTSVGTAFQPIRPQRPKQILCVDIVPMPHCGPYSYLLLAIDHFSKFAFARPSRSAKTSELLSFLRHLFYQVGKFEVLLSDPGPQFRSLALKRFLKQHGTRHDKSIRRHFEGNGCLERFVRTLSEALAKLGATDDNWPSKLQQTINAYNSRPHSTTDAEPHAVFFNSPARLPLDHDYGTRGAAPPTQDQVADTRDLRTSTWKRASARRRPLNFAPGDEVFHVPRRDSDMIHARARRFQPRRSGPYIVIEEYPRQQYLCTDGYTQILLPAWEMQGPLFKNRGESKGKGKRP